MKQYEWLAREAWGSNRRFTTLLAKKAYIEGFLKYREMAYNLANKYPKKESGRILFESISPEEFKLLGEEEV